MANRLASDLFADPTKWDDPAPDHAALLAAYGGGAAATGPATYQGVLNTAARSPVAILFKVTGDVGHIYVGHSLTRFPAQVGANTPFDDLAVVLLGDDLTAASPVCLPAGAWTRTAATRCHNVAALVAGHAAGVPVYTTGPHGPGAADTDELRVRSAFLVDPTIATDVLHDSPNGVYTLQGFYQTFLQPVLDGADAAARTAYEPMRDWWRVACTIDGAGASVIGLNPLQSALPLQTQRLTAWAQRQRTSQLARLGVGGPGLTTAAFTAGVTDIRNTLNANANDRLDYERARSQQSFTEKHGAALAQKLYHLCSVVRDEDLPETHRLLAKSPRGREAGILTNALEDRVQASPLPIALSNVPLVTTKILDEVFRSFTVSGSGLIFGQGLSPFSVVCSGHAEGAAVASKLRQAAMAESGTTLSLADAAKLTATDVRFPTTPQVAAEKLFGWSIFLDVFHGPAAAISDSVRAMVTQVAPLLHTIHTHYGGTDMAGASMDVVNRVLYDIQQDYFQWATSTGHGRVLAVPDFSRVKGLVSSFRAESLSPLPASWYVIMEPPARPRNRSSGPNNNGNGSGSRQSNPRDLSGSTSKTNPDADSRLVNRFRDSEYSTITALMQGHDCTVPKHGSEEVCLSWALKGRCHSMCQRKDQHQRYSRDTIRAIHALLDDCGVANAQE